MEQRFDNFKAGLVAVVGKPNVGKSTLINRYLGEKISIISPKPQTTRNRILAILNQDNYQIIFVDTPGIHEPKHLLGKYMVREAESSLEDADVILVMLDATTGIEPEDRHLLELVSEYEKKKTLAVNKIDAINKPELLPILDEVRKIAEFDEYIPISALEGENTDLLLQKIVEFLPQSPPLYPQDQLSDKPQKFHVAELIREKILENTYEEIPHSVAVVVDEFKEREEKNLIYIKAIIYVERPSQKKIIIGHDGKMLKKIGTKARMEIERFLGRRVFLDLWVKVYEKWRRDSMALNRLGYK
ncbi:MAG TPA: GTPase Era [Candidatus Omnitrophica bacterium]|nr:GTPase Era [Candidatus Omnitrophota bacterium]